MGNFIPPYTSILQLVNQGNGVFSGKTLNSTAINPSLVATRTTGPAPFAVGFDAVDTTHEDGNIDTFRQLGYYFDYDDETSGTWAETGASKNVDFGGPIGYHVYETPGTYKVLMRVRDAEGAFAQMAVDITVTDPDVVFAGINTICISTGSDMSGAPAGSQHLINQIEWPTFESNKRYLLHAGDNFLTFGSLRTNHISDFQISSFGVGANPIVGNIEVLMNEDLAATPPQNGTIDSIEAQEISHNMMFKHFSVLKCICVQPGSRINFAGAISYFAENQRGLSAPEDWVHSGPVYISECHVNMQGDISGPLNAISGMAKNIFIAGNWSEEAKEHTIRLFGAYRSYIKHNRLEGPATDGIRTCIKLMANGSEDWPIDNRLFEPATSTTRKLSKTQYVVLGDNIYGDGDWPGTWAVQFAPQDSGQSNTIEFIEDVIDEGSTWVNGTGDDGLSRAVQTMGVNITVRGASIPVEWTTKYQVSTYPSDYSIYSSVYAAERHGPYYMDDAVPAVQEPVRV